MVIYSVLSITHMLTPHTTSIIPRNVPALILSSPKSLPVNVVMIIVKELVTGTATDKSADASVR